MAAVFIHSPECSPDVIIFISVPNPMTAKSHAYRFQDALSAEASLKDSSHTTKFAFYSTKKRTAPPLECSAL